MQRQFVVFWAIIGFDGGGSWQKWATRPTPTLTKGGIDRPFALMPWIILVHSLSPCCTVFSLLQRSEPVTTALVDITPIMKLDLSKL
ncbi:uncharacterized protein M421DRAFT_389058 [Didymella exigua CBS 183.55]|uniref:Uncharacterized protein n=1 Tax=Didymella exigua CBS 183.55 TaxID=1150837 RepID=A0A6A5S4C7_9PLEO|nr:uncharacterized protein M421DRAFT_389058 [Didymella exigua CBS 183.55]KAF1934450.1 hypothetical protein M421DRAFT_389058 [Didymella exigua CBS 183.55]